MSALCRDCDWRGPPGPAAAAAGRCPDCGSPRLFAHAELDTLAIAHLDCDSFYASVEKRDRPELRDRPVIVGGGVRGVVTTACYIARTYGCRSAMPMFTALKLCPQAAVVRPDFAKYTFESRRIMAMMRELTPLVQPLSLDEAWLDLSGSERLHGGPAAWTLARLQRRIERETGLTVSVGVAPNKVLAKIASDLDKPRGLAAIGAAEAREFLAPRPVTLLPGVGPAFARSLERAGYTRIGQLAAADSQGAGARPSARAACACTTSPTAATPGPSIRKASASPSAPRPPSTRTCATARPSPTACGPAARRRPAAPGRAASPAAWSRSS